MCPPAVRSGARSLPHAGLGAQRPPSPALSPGLGGPPCGSRSVTCAVGAPCQPAETAEKRREGPPAKAKLTPPRSRGARRGGLSRGSFRQRRASPRCRPSAPPTLVPFPQEAEGPRAREPPRLRRRASRRRGRGRRVGRPSAGPPSPLGAWGSAPACADQEGRWGDTAPALPALRHPSASSPTPALLPHMVRGGPSRPLPPLRFVSREPRCLARPAHGRGAP